MTQQRQDSALSFSTSHPNLQELPLGVTSPKHNLSSQDLSSEDLGSHTEQNPPKRCKIQREDHKPTILKHEIEKQVRAIQVLFKGGFEALAPRKIRGESELLRLCRSKEKSHDIRLCNIIIAKAYARWYKSSLSSVPAFSTRNEDEDTKTVKNLVRYGDKVLRIEEKCKGFSIVPFAVGRQYVKSSFQDWSSAISKLSHEIINLAKNLQPQWEDLQTQSRENLGLSSLFLGLAKKSAIVEIQSSQYEDGIRGHSPIAHGRRIVTQESITPEQQPYDDSAAISPKLLDERLLGNSQATVQRAKHSQVRWEKIQNGHLMTKEAVRVEASQVDNNHALPETLSSSVSYSPASLENTSQIFQCSEQAQHIAILLHAFGKPEIPLELFARARLPSSFWNKFGEISERQIALDQAVQDKDVFERAIEELCQSRVLTKQDGRLQLYPEAVLCLINGAQSDYWEGEAFKIICLAVPTDRRLAPAHSYTRASSTIPFLQAMHPRALTLASGGVIDPGWLVEVCLFASLYSDSTWKEQFLALAETLVANHKLDKLQRARVSLRRAVLNRISSSDWAIEATHLEFPRSDQRSNGFYADYLMSRADTLYKSSGLDAALKELRSFEYWDPQQPSTLERAQKFELGVVEGRILHFSGHFSEARLHLEQTLSNKHQETSALVKVLNHLSFVCCELGNTKRGIQYAEHLTEVTKDMSNKSWAVKRTKLALGYTYLLHIMQNALSGVGRPSAKDSAKLNDLFLELEPLLSTGETRAHKISRLSVRLGLAALAHLNNQSGKALSHYELALIAAQNCGWMPGWIEKQILLSMSLVLSQLGRPQEARRSKQESDSIDAQASYYFPGFGTYWPDLITKWSNKSS